MKRNAQRPTTSGPLSTLNTTGARTHAHSNADRGAITFLAVLTALALVMGTMVPAAFADTTSGTTTDTTSATVIKSLADLQAFQNVVNNGTTYEGETVQLAADIDISGSDWTPIGSGSSTGTNSHPFKGVFDGGSHTVTGLTITSTSSPLNALGFFGVLDGAQVKNLTLADVNINVPTSELAGGIAGIAINNSNLSSVHVEGSISGASNIGGIVGSMAKSGMIMDSQNAASVTGTGKNIGGIVGSATGTSLQGEMTITTSINNGAVSGAQAVGGIAGLSAARISFGMNTGTVTATTGPVGGIVGEQTNYGALVSNTNSGRVTNASATGSETGGIVGLVDYSGSATAYAKSSAIEVRNNTNMATVEGGEDAGGIIGTMYSAGTVTGNINKASAISATTYAAGIVGNLQENTGKSLPSPVTESITVENNTSTTPETALDAATKGLFAAHNDDPAKFIVAANSTGAAADDPATTPDTDDPTQTPEPTDPAGAPITNPAVGSPSDKDATQQGGTADPNAVADNTTQTGASLQQTGDDLGRVLGVLAAIAVTAGLTMLFVRKRS